MVKDFNLPNVDWVNGLVVSPVNSISQHFRIQNEYLDLFIMKGSDCFREENTLGKLMVNRLDNTALYKGFQMINI